MTTYVIPCCGDKLDTPAAARDFYTGSMFRHSLAAAQAMAADDPGPILVLSAYYGLVPLDRVLHPYDQRMDEPGRVDPTTIQATFVHHADHAHDVVALLPRVYFDALASALEELWIRPLDCYQATAGIGEQRHINALALAA